MDYNEITLTVDIKDLENAAAIANMAVPYGIYIEDYSDLEQEAFNIAHIDLIDEDLIKKDRSIAVIHVYIPIQKNPNEEIEFLKSRLNAAKINFTVNVNTLLESSYKNNWKNYFKKQTVGKKLLICPKWEKPGNTKRKVLYIDPGAAFGTGTHATTKMCLELLEKTVKKESSVLDIGTGSGILSVAAVMLGAKSALGVDIDSTAIKVSKETAQLNNVQNNCTFLVGDAIKDITGQYDVLVANIVADVIIYLSDKIKPLLNQNGIFICSGIIDIRAKEVEDALIKSGMKIVYKVKTDNWYAFGGQYDRI